MKCAILENLEGGGLACLTGSAPYPLPQHRGLLHVVGRNARTKRIVKTILSRHGQPGNVTGNIGHKRKISCGYPSFGEGKTFLLSGRKVKTRGGERYLRRGGYDFLFRKSKTACCSRGTAPGTPDKTPLPSLEKKAGQTCLGPRGGSAKT